MMSYQSTENHTMGQQRPTTPMPNAAVQILQHYGAMQDTAAQAIAKHRKELVDFHSTCLEMLRAQQHYAQLIVRPEVRSSPLAGQIAQVVQTIVNDSNAISNRLVEAANAIRALEGTTNSDVYMMKAIDIHQHMHETCQLYDYNVGPQIATLNGLLQQISEVKCG